MYSRNTNQTQTPAQDSSTMEPTETGMLSVHDGSDEAEEHTSKILDDYADNLNIANDLDERTLGLVGMYVLSGVSSDKSSQKEWLTMVEDAQRLATLKKEPKSYPLPQSANIKYPLITNACYQFAAKTYPEVIKNARVAKGEVLAADPTGMYALLAEAMSLDMSARLLGSDTTWEKNLDQLLVTYANIGFVCKKKFYDTNKDCVDEVLCDYKDLIIRNATEIHCLGDLQRITHALHCTSNDLMEGMRSGIYCEEAVEEILARQDPDSNDLIDLYECHCFYDLDEDGYKEPYIVTVDSGSGKVLRIVARFNSEDVLYNDKKQVKKINACQYFVDFHFLPSPDGRFMSMGFGTLMLHLNETVNTILNQLIDAGTLANLQFGFIDSRLKVMGGQQFNDPGQWNMVKGVSSASGGRLQDMVLPLNYKEPSAVLFQLLGLVIQASKELSASTDIMSGQQDSQNSPANTTAILAEQGLKLFSSIQRRLYRSLKDEFGLIKELIKNYCDPTEVVMIGQQPLSVKELYSVPKVKIIPVADPNLSSDAQRMAKLQYLLQLMTQPGTAQYINGHAAVTAIVTGLQLPNPASFVQQPPQQPNPDMLKVQVKAQKDAADHEIKARGMDLKEKDYLTKLAKTEADIEEKQAKSYNLVTEADQMKHQSVISAAKVGVSVEKVKIDAAQAQHKQLSDSDMKLKQMHLDQQNADRTHELGMQEAENAKAIGSNTMDGTQSNESPPADNQGTL